MTVLSRISGQCAALALLLALPASAASGSTTARVIDVKMHASGLTFHLSDSPTVTYYAQQGTARCSALNAVSGDTVKIWFALAQGALLSGKSVTVYWEDCGVGAPYVRDIVLKG